MSEKMAVQGEASVRYGEGTECGTEGDIKVKFNHETTQEGRDDLKEKWYYKQCMAQKAKPEWSARGGNKLPTTEACYMTLWDATAARHYHWEMEFVKLTNRMKSIISNVRSLVSAGLIPYYDESPDTGDYSVSDDVGPFLNADVIFKNSDKNVDLKVETSQGVREYQWVILIFSNSLASFNLQVNILVRILENNISIQEWSNVIRHAIITSIGALIVVGDESSRNKGSDI